MVVFESSYSYDGPGQMWAAGIYLISESYPSQLES